MFNKTPEHKRITIKTPEYSVIIVQLIKFQLQLFVKHVLTS